MEKIEAAINKDGAVAVFVKTLGGEKPVKTFFTGSRMTLVLDGKAERMFFLINRAAAKAAIKDRKILIVEIDNEDVFATNLISAQGIG
jgi:hypothetical protein